MNIIKKENILSKSLFIYFVCIFFYGLIIKLTFFSPVLFKLKTYIPEFFLGLVCLTAIPYLRKTNRNSRIMIFTFCLIMVLNIFTSFSLASFMMTFRDVLIPLIVGFFLCNAQISVKEKNWFFKALTWLSIIALASGTILGILQYFKGWEWTSAWYTGYPFWGEDTASSMYIMTNGSHVRVPSITGHNVKFAMYSFFQFLIIAFYSKNMFKSNLTRNISAALGMINIYISNNKTTIVIVLLTGLYWFIKKYGKMIIKKCKEYTKIKYGLIGIALVIGIIIIVVLMSSNFLLSFFDRFSKWSALLKPRLLLNLIIPISTYSFAGNSVTSIPVLNYWDNTYLYFLYSFGIIGVIVLYRWLRGEYKTIEVKHNDKVDRDFIFYLTLFTCIAGFTTSLVLGRCFFNIFVIILSYLSAVKKGIKS